MIVLPDTRILSPLFCFSKKRLFEEISECAAACAKCSSKNVIIQLNEREKCGSTVFYPGVAIPHAVIHNLDNDLAVLSILDKPVSFNSVGTDEQYVDIAFALFISESSDHDETEKLLEDLTTILSNNDLLNALRLSKNEKPKLEKILNQIDLLLDKLSHGQVESEERSEITELQQ